MTPSISHPYKAGMVGRKKVIPCLSPQEQVFKDIFEASLRVISRELLITPKQARELVTKELSRCQI